MLVGEDQRALLPMAALMGAIFMAEASVLSNLISPGGMIPIGFVPAVIGCNVACKSTLLHTLAGLGTMLGIVSFSGTRLSPQEQRQHIVYLPQDTGAQSSLTVL